jgi:aspartate kinase
MPILPGLSRAHRVTSVRMLAQATLVMKFGGTSVADAERIKRAARRIVAQREAGNRVVAVLSARGKTTDELITMAEEVSEHPDPREMDMLLSTGERISCALCAMAINDLGHPAISLTGSQAGIVTDTSHTKARILDVRADRIREALADDLIVLVAGFQGVSTSRDVTTLGRGGSDTTAVALAAAIGAEVCEIYTDVAGVFSADPRLVPGARKLPVVSFEEMLEMAASGAKVLQLRSVEYARTHGVRIHCRSSFEDGPGTFVIGEDETVEHPLITAVTHSTEEARITLLGVPDRPGAAAAIFSALARAEVNLDTIIQNEPRGEGRDAEVSFTIAAEDLRAAERALEPIRDELGLTAIDTDRHIGKVSIVGAGMRSHPGVAAKVFEVLAEEEINIEMISTSPIKISCVIRAQAVPTAVRALHQAFGLEASEVQQELPLGQEAR